MVLGQLIAELREKRSLSQSSLAKMLNVSQSTVAMWETNKRGMSDETLSAVADFFNVSTDYLLGRTANPVSNVNLKQVDLDDLIHIPIVGTIRCGSGGIAYTDYEGTQAYSKSNLDMSHDYVVLKTKGDSMSGDGISDGDLALIQKEADFVQNKIYAVAVNGDEATLKRVNKMDGAIMLNPSNPEYPPIFITGEELNDVKIIGRLINIQRNF